MSKGSIYKVYCWETEKAYIGQTRDMKYKGGVPYNYGIVGRWNDHLSCPATTPLGVAIAENGPDAFEIICLESGIDESRLDEREAYWIASEKTLHPNGYNVMRHGRCRHRTSSSLAEFYAPTTVGVRLRQIKRGGAPHLIYAYLDQNDGSEVRLVFGQGKDSSYTQAVSDAKSFLTPLSTIPIEADPRVLDSTATEYDTKLARFDDVTVNRIRLAKFNTLVAVYIDNQRICFGGKRTSYAEAVTKALTFAHALMAKHPTATLINDTSKSATGGCS